VARARQLRPANGRPDFSGAKQALVEADYDLTSYPRRDGSSEPGVMHGRGTSYGQGRWRSARIMMQRVQRAIFA